MLGVVVLGQLVLVHVETGKAPGPVEQCSVVGIGKALQKEGRIRLAIVHPIELRRELSEVHPLPCQRHLHRLGFGVLAQMAFPAPLVPLQDGVRCSECV